MQHTLHRHRLMDGLHRHRSGGSGSGGGGREVLVTLR